MRNHSNQRYGKITIALHWLTFIVMVAVYACIELRGLFPKGSDPRETMKALHFMLGLLVLMLLLPRLGFRLAGTTPAISPEPPAWQRQAARLVHLLLYGLMLGMPIAGWLLLSAAGKTIPFFGLELPALIAENKELAKSIKEIHETGGEIGYYLIGLHVSAVLFHHYVQRDNTLSHMLPALRKQD